MKWALDLGISNFGENRLQESEAKIDTLGNTVCWHFIGSIQSKKAKKISSLFDWVQTVDRIKIAKILNELGDVSIINLLLLFLQLLS